jgi:hypothetical protein
VSLDPPAPDQHHACFARQEATATAHADGKTTEMTCTEVANDPYPPQPDRRAPVVMYGQSRTPGPRPDPGLLTRTRRPTSPATASPARNTRGGDRSCRARPADPVPDRGGPEPPVHGGYTRSRQVEKRNGHERSPRELRNRRSGRQRRRHQAPLQTGGRVRVRVSHPAAMRPPALPTRLRITEDEPHPPAELGGVGTRCEPRRSHRWGHPRAIRSGRERYVADRESALERHTAFLQKGDAPAERHPSKRLIFGQRMSFSVSGSSPCSFGPEVCSSPWAVR